MTRFFRSCLGCRGALLWSAATLSFACSIGEKTNDACAPNDADGVIDEPAILILTVTDGEFMPQILATQNTSQITLTLENTGTTRHSFVVDCLPTPNTDGCPMTACFPPEARIPPVEPAAKATILFQTPLVEGIYTFRSDVAEDTELTPGQFIVQ